MTVDSKHVELINADLDGEISEVEREALARFLADNADARQLRDELAQLCERLDTMEEVEPPPHLKYAILEAARTQQRSTRGGATDEPGTWRQLLAVPIFRHAVAFAAGVVMTLALVSSNRISDRAFDDVTGLVGTISESVPAGAGLEQINLTNSDIAGTVSIHQSGSLTVVDFDLVAAGPVEIVAGFPERDVWFKGFAQLENEGATVHAQSGSVKMQMQGKNRYAMYLSHASRKDAVISLKFYAAGSLIHEAELSMPGNGK